MQYSAVVKFGCQPPDEVELDLAQSLMASYYHYFLLKLYDFMDTVFFILRKKQKQVTFLHTFHHTGIFLVSWMAIRYFPVSYQTPAGPVVFYGLWNTFVHALMYTYYLFSSLGMINEKNIWCKKYVTMLQMVQHLAVFYIGASLILDPKCFYPKHYITLFMFFLVIIIFLFGKFYVRAYISTGAKNKSKVQ